MANNKPLKESTVKRYTDVYITLRVNQISLSEASKLTEAQYINKTGRSKSEFRLVKSLAKNTYVQNNINEYIDNKGIQSNLIKPIKVQDYTTVKEAQKEKEIKKEPETTQTTFKRNYYTLIEAIDDKKNSFWIKAKNNKDLHRQLDIIIKSGSANSWTSFINHGKRKYKGYIDKEFSELLVKEGVSVQD